MPVRNLSLPLDFLNVEYFLGRNRYAQLLGHSLGQVLRGVRVVLDVLSLHHVRLGIAHVVDAEVLLQVAGFES